MTDSRPIGVFDSGVGGLSVLAALRDALPAERFVYLGDTARLPYGAKTAATVERYSLQCARHLVARDIKALVVACNTAASGSLAALARAFAPLLVVGVLEPGAAAAVDASLNGRIAVLATEGTIAGGAYERAIRARASQARVTGIACPLFVALAEEGLTEGPIVSAIARHYLADLPAEVDTVVLGCTHFPVLAPTLRELLGPTRRIVDSARTTAAALKDLLGDLAGPGSEPAPRSRVTLLATDGPARFARVGSTFLGSPIDLADVEVVDLGG